MALPAIVPGAKSAAAGSVRRPAVAWSRPAVRPSPRRTRPSWNRASGSASVRGGCFPTGCPVLRTRRACAAGRSADRSTPGTARGGDRRTASAPCRPACHRMMPTRASPVTGNFGDDQPGDHAMGAGSGAAQDDPDAAAVRRCARGRRHPGRDESLDTDRSYDPTGDRGVSRHVMPLRAGLPVRKTSPELMLLRVRVADSHTAAGHSTKVLSCDAAPKSAFRGSPAHPGGDRPTLHGTWHMTSSSPSLRAPPRANAALRWSGVIPTVSDDLLSRCVNSDLDRGTCGTASSPCSRPAACLWKMSQPLGALRRDGH